MQLKIFAVSFLVLLVIIVVLLSGGNEKILGRLSSSPVDVVYTWVDGSDPEWKMEKQKFESSVKGGTTNKTDSQPKRFGLTKNPSAEIELSLESVQKNIGWVDKIYIVASRPQTLPDAVLSKYRAKMVYHDEIFPDQAVLPVFSSCAIESCLHRIPGLKEKFIYFNDDTYINKPMSYSDFFKSGKPVYRKQGFTLAQTNDTSTKIYQSAVQKGIDLFGGRQKFTPIHQAAAVTKTIMRTAETKFIKEWTSVRSARMRSKDEILPVYVALALASDTNQVVSTPDHITALFIGEDLKNSHSTKPRLDEYMICLNDGTDEGIKSLRSKMGLSSETD